MEQNNLNKIAENIKKLKEEVFETADKCNRDAEEITIVGVSKRFPAEYAKMAFECGIENLGENRVEELLMKKQTLDSLGIYPKWHMIGSLQRKKVKTIIGQTNLIHSVDSHKLFDEIAKESKKNKEKLSVLLQLNASGEESKHGFTKDELLSCFSEMLNEEWVSINGIMTMAPFTDDEKILNKVFFDTKEIFENIKQKYNLNHFTSLSMGMSNDYKIAIKHGATHIRVGTVIFGERSS